MVIILFMIFLFFGFLSNLLGILINPVSMLISLPFALYVFKVKYRWGILFIFSYYGGLFALGPILLNFDPFEIPLLIRSIPLSIVVFTVGSLIPYSLTVFCIKAKSKH